MERVECPPSVLQSMNVIVVEVKCPPECECVVEVEVKCPPDRVKQRLSFCVSGSSGIKEFSY